MDVPVAAVLAPGLAGVVDWDGPVDPLRVLAIDRKAGTITLG